MRGLRLQASGFSQRREERPHAPSAGDASPGTESETNETNEEASGGPGLRPENIRSLRLGHGANCSSVGSVIDTLFLGAAVGGAIFAAVCAAMRDEPIRVVGSPRPGDERVRADTREDEEPTT
jgi:hypothetical protein